MQGVSPFHFLAVLLSVRSRLAATPAWLARAVRPCPCDVPLPAAQPPSQHGAVVAWDRDQAGGRNQGYCGSWVYDPVLHHREPHATQCEMQRKPERVSVLGLKEALLGLTRGRSCPIRDGYRRTWCRRIVHTITYA